VEIALFEMTRHRPTGRSIIGGKGIDAGVATDLATRNVRVVAAVLVGRCRGDRESLAQIVVLLLASGKVTVEHVDQAANSNKAKRTRAVQGGVN
jgi:hypothetical protein